VELVIKKRYFLWIFLAFCVILKAIPLFPILASYSKSWDNFCVNWMNEGMNFPKWDKFREGKFWYKDYPSTYPVLYILQNPIFYVLNNYFSFVVCCGLVTVAFYFVYFRLLKIRKNIVNLSLFFLLFGLIYNNTLVNVRLFHVPLSGLFALLSFYYFREKDFKKSSVFVSLAILGRQYYAIFLFAYLLLIVFSRKKKAVIDFVVPFVIIVLGSTLVLELYSHKYIYYTLLFRLQFHREFPGAGFTPTFVVLCVLIIPSLFSNLKFSKNMDINILKFVLAVYLMGVFKIGDVYLHPIIIFLLPLFETFHKEKMKFKRVLTGILLVVLLGESIADLINVPYNTKLMEIQGKYNTKMLELVPLIEKPIISDRTPLLKYDVPFMEEIIGDVYTFWGEMQTDNLPQSYFIDAVKEKNPDFIIVRSFAWDGLPMWQTFLLRNYRRVSAPLVLEMCDNCIRYMQIFTNSDEKYEKVKEIYSDELKKGFEEEFRELQEMNFYGFPTSLSKIDR